MLKGILITALLVVCGAARAFDAAPLLPWVTEHTDDPYLVAWYKLDGDALDSSRNANHGTVTGAVVSNNTRTAYYFDGNGDRIAAAATTANADVWATGGTLALWVTWTGGGGNNLGRFFAKGSTQAYCNAGRQPHFFRTLSGGPRQWQAVGAIAANTWTHLTIVYSDATPTNTPVYYVNGVPEAMAVITDNTGSAVSDAGQVLYFGDNSGFNRGWNGLIDDVRIYNRALSSNDVSRIYQGLIPLHD